MVNKYVQFVKYNLFIVFMLRMLFKNSKHVLGVVNVFVDETFADEVIKYLLCKHFFVNVLQVTAKHLLSGFRKCMRT